MRGRPPGSKNKPKPPVVITRDVVLGDLAGFGAFRTQVLEIPPGNDVAESIATFARGLEVQAGICVLAGYGPVSTATIRQSFCDEALSVRGCFDILSISAVFLPPRRVAGSMSLSLAGPQGQVVGGIVAGPVVSARKVVVVMASFSNPAFHRLPVDEGQTSGSVSTLCRGGRGDGGKDQSDRTLPPQQNEEQRWFLHGIHSPEDAGYGDRVFDSSS
ncbi:hypothetical protein HPP92_027158 [Vanilla planifolia]|uniref:AT-hook motif nuclear-localized protein n=1 Tax=Vanilla planifolia TaxID=51239 RepID=A0A835U875_VANPL|nr:hypothetical protein HPP92_027158 [Vanilla planifolia]